MHFISGMISRSYRISAGIVSSIGQGLTVFLRSEYSFRPVVWTMKTSSAS
jgi:hypothetical protein